MSFTSNGISLIRISLATFLPNYPREMEKQNTISSMSSISNSHAQLLYTLDIYIEYDREPKKKKNI